ncbi:hypothetical protein [Pseudonocardia ammonioxydans]|uniref:hypothetical protein n=1 Tax=Pseudonocardia ammonioxydans TaxID=260086 RepID=UPI003184510E
MVLSAEVSDPANHPVPPEVVQRAYDGIEGELHERMDAQQLPFKSVDITREVDIRYSMQLSEVATPVPAGSLDQEALEGVAETFDELYAKLYGSEAGFRDAGLQLITYRAYATGTLPFSSELPGHETGSGTPAPSGQRRAFLSHEAGWQDAAVYQNADLRAGHRFAGPAIVEADTTTLAVPAGMNAEVDRLGNVVLTDEKGA